MAANLCSMLEQFSNFWWLRSANHFKFIEEFMCTEKHVSVKKNVYKRTKHELAAMNQKESME